ncbi:MAG: STAS-like domain-containing protein [Algicola sp.]|nr:STAS-like domain-containing protein [Algicola sp.]
MWRLTIKTLKVDNDCIKIIVSVSSFRFGQELLISRSQARRLLTCIASVEIVVFDFNDITRIGQAFADEIFRVYAKRNPQIELLYQNVCKDVEFMILRAKGG